MAASFRVRTCFGGRFRLPPGLPGEARTWLLMIFPSSPFSLPFSGHFHFRFHIHFQKRMVLLSTVMSSPPLPLSPPLAPVKCWDTNSMGTKGDVKEGWELTPMGSSDVGQGGCQLQT